MLIGICLFAMKGRQKKETTAQETLRHNREIAEFKKEQEASAKKTRDDLDAAYRATESRERYQARKRADIEQKAEDARQEASRLSDAERERKYATDRQEATARRTRENERIRAEMDEAVARNRATRAEEDARRKTADVALSKATANPDPGPRLITTGKEKADAHERGRAEEEEARTAGRKRAPAREEMDGYTAADRQAAQARRDREDEQWKIEREDAAARGQAARARYQAQRDEHERPRPRPSPSAPGLEAAQRAGLADDAREREQKEGTSIQSRAKRVSQDAASAKGPPAQTMEPYDQRNYPVVPYKPGDRDGALVPAPRKGKATAPKAGPGMAETWGPRLTKAKQAYDIAKAGTKAAKGWLARPDFAQVKADFFAQNSNLDPENLDQEDRWRLNDAMLKYEIGQQTSIIGEFSKSIPVIEGIDVGAIVNAIGSASGWIMEAGEMVQREQDRAGTRAYDDVGKVSGVPYAYMGPKVLDPSRPYADDPGHIFGEAYAYATKNMKKDWDQLNFSWERPDLGGLRSEKEMLDWYAEHDGERYTRYFGGIGYEAQQKTGNWRDAEVYGDMLKEAKDRGMIGHMTPYAIHQQLLKERDARKAMDDYTALIDAEQTKINGEEALPGNVIYDQGSERYFYGEEDFHRESEPTFIPKRTRYEMHPVDQYGDDIWGRSSRGVQHLNSKNTALTVMDEDIHNPRRRTSYRGDFYEPEYPRRDSYYDTPMQYGRDSYYSQRQATHDDNMTYDPSANPGLASAVPPSTKNVTTYQAPPSDPLSSNQFLVGIGDDEHSAPVYINEQITNNDITAHPGTMGYEAPKEKAAPVNPANAKNPAAPRIADEKQKAAAEEDPEAPKPTINYLRGVAMEIM